MSHQLINRSPDLARLRDEGFDIEVRATYLIVKDVPYIRPNREIGRGMLISKLNVIGDVTQQPDDHVAYFVGEHPCNADGSEIQQIKHSSQPTVLDTGLVASHSFSARPLSGKYSDYFHKMSTYAAILSSKAQELDPSATARTFPAIVDGSTDTPFVYLDTASSRANILAVTRKLQNERVGIVGAGGSGAYTLDFVAKTPVAEIRLFDDDRFSQHNAFRSPGAASLDSISEKLSKVAYLAAIYSRMHKAIVPHEVRIVESNLALLSGLTFVFICIDDAAAKRIIFEYLTSQGIPFCDVGMGLYVTNNQISGIVRATTVTPEKADHISRRVSLVTSQGDDIYSRNIQIAELNAMCAFFAVMKWKKRLGFYADALGEHQTTFTIDRSMLLSSERE